MSALNNSALIGASGSTGYQISRSVRLRSSASAYFNRTPASAGNRKTWTWSGWVKRGTLGTVYPPLLMGGTTLSDTGVNAIQFQADALGFIGYNTNFLITTQVFRDPSAWYHLVVAFDSTQATATNRIKMYVNGSQITSFSTDNRASITQNGDYAINQAALHTIGYQSAAFGSNYLDGYLTEINFIDGQALTPASFGETNAVTGVWQPKKYTGTYGTNGFYLNFSDNSGVTATTIGKDYSGNGNNWTPNNISVTAGATYDSMLDVPTQWADGGNGRGNYATLNPIGSSSSSVINISDGNLKATTSVASISSFFKAGASIAVSTGKWYFESTVGAINVNNWAISIAATPPLQDSSNQNGTLTGEVAYFGKAASFETIYVSNTATYTGTSAAVVNDVIGVAFDADARTIQFYRNNSAISTAQTIPLASTYYISFIVRNNTTAAIHNINFGQQPFAYTPPSGFKALNTLNLPTPTILKGNQYFDATLWTGDGASSRSITGVQFQPDLVWAKSRSLAIGHTLFDAVRGVGSTKALYSNSSEAEGGTIGSTASSQYGYVSSLNSDGFSVSVGSVNANYVNNNTSTYVGWQWKEGATQGFDIVTYTGNGGTQNISHNLGVAPRMMIVKSRSVAQRWTVYHASVSNAYLYLNETFAADTANAALRFGNNSAVVQPTSSVFTIGNSVDVNQNTTTYVAYLFAEVAGFSAFGSYTGNGSADGPMVFTGFLPRWIMFKKSSSTSNWSIIDTARDTFNVVDNPVLANTAGAETTSTSTSGAFLDVLSNGFKLRGNSGDINDSGATYIFAAFAENPFKYSLAR